jgi:enoyl-CoA hydratase
MDFQHIQWSTPEDGIAVVTLSRPDRLNTLTRPLFDELERALDRIEADDAIRVWVLTGAPRPDGRPCFSAGVDVKAFAEGDGVDEETTCSSPPSP